MKANSQKQRCLALRSKKQVITSSDVLFSTNKIDEEQKKVYPYNVHEKIIFKMHTPVIRTL